MPATPTTARKLSRGLDARVAKQFGVVGRGNIDFERFCTHENHKAGKGAYNPRPETIRSQCLKIQQKWTDEDRLSRIIDGPIALMWPGPFCCECGRPVVDESCERTDLICGKCFGFTAIQKQNKLPRQNKAVEHSELQYHGEFSRHVDNDYWQFQIDGSLSRA